MTLRLWLALGGLAAGLYVSCVGPQAGRCHRAEPYAAECRAWGRP